jgi:uncharacterized protein YciI
MDTPDTPPDMESFSFVILRRGPRAHEFAGEELDAIQAGHLAHLDAMRERGALLVAGPFSDQEDETLRGICLYGTDLDETRRLCELDPAVRCGRMRADVMTWWTQRGAVAFAGA